MLAQTLPKKEEAPPPPPSTASTPETKPAEAPAPDPVAALTTRVDDLSKQVASLPRAEPDLKPIEAKIDALAKRLDSTAIPDTKAAEEKAAQAGATAAAVQAKIDALTKSVDAEKAELAAVKDQLKSLSESRPTPVPAATAAPASNAAADAEFAKAVELFKKNQFAPARDAFAKLQESMPNDARVWYYGALSTGFATSDWNGEPVKLVTKGKELEKAGKPAAAEINAAFADLPAATKAWLDAYRNR
jgi:TolA-binding protein